MQIMFIEFSISNFYSFNEVQTLSFRATGLDSVNSKVDNSNLISTEQGRFLKIIGLYGANASGKTNFIKAISFFRDMIVRSVSQDRLSSYGYEPFKQLRNDSEKPSYFQAIISLESKKYRYGFTVNLHGEIDSEWLFGPADKNETYYFKRSQQEIFVNNEWFSEANSLPEGKLRSDALFLTFCSTYNGPISQQIRNFFQTKITIDGRLPNLTRRVLGSRGNFATNQLIEDGDKETVLMWLKEVGLLYNEIKLIKREESITTIVELYKNVYDLEGKVVGQTTMSLSSDESEGTKKFYSYIGLLHRKFVSGGLYICDEIDSNFHPSLLQKIISLFQNENTNKANAQLLLTSHDTNLLDPDIMRRDQFYFTEKNLLEATKLYSLSDLKGIRNNADFARQYLAGLYGALPILGNYLENDDESQIIGEN
jgi:AAA15 family ATPase/GTPase